MTLQIHSVSTRKILSVLILMNAVVAYPSHAAEFKIAVEQSLADADVTTHQIKSGDVILGISEFGGGYINKLEIPGIGDIIADRSARYGRGGQASIRDELHSRHYNPTQAGFSDRAGTYNVIEQPTSGTLFIPPRPASLFDGDRKYDFTEWENLAKDPFPRDHGDSDEDGIDESQLPGKQATEITSEFDFTGSYKDVRDGKNIVIPAFQISYEFRFIREPGHCISQFGKSTPAYDPSAEIDNRANLEPPGKYPSTPDSLTGIILSSTIRGDKAVWDPDVEFFVDETGKLTSSTQSSSIRQQFVKDSRPAGGYPLIIFATSTDPNHGPSIGYYFPRSHVNQFSTVGRSVKDNSISYEDNRTTEGAMIGSFDRAQGMWLFGVKADSLGLLNRKETPAGVYESIRGESYILVGTPNEIYAAAQAIQQHFP